MTNQWFNIADEKLLTYLSGLDKSLTEASIPCMIFGGVATQAHIARYLTQIHGRDLLDLATSGVIDISNFMRSTNNVDIALGLVQNVSYTQKIADLESQSKEAEKNYGRARKLLLKGKKGAVENLDRQEQERKARFSNLVRAVDDERKAMRDQRFNSILDSFADAELDSLTEGNPITVKQSRRGYSRLVYTLGEYGQQNDKEPLTVNVCREAQDVSKNGCLNELDAELYSSFLFGAQAGKVKIPYMDTSVSLRVMTPEDLLVTKILMWRHNDREDAQRLVNYARESGNPINYDIIEDIVHKKRKVIYRENEVEKCMELENPILAERYEIFKRYVESKPVA